MKKVLSNMPDSILRRIDYIPNMPKISVINDMTQKEVNELLGEIPTSMYHGLTADQVCAEINKSQSFRYLTELVLLNEIIKSSLDPISE